MAAVLMDCSSANRCVAPKLILRVLEPRPLSTLPVRAPKPRAVQQRPTFTGGGAVGRQLQRNRNLFRSPNLRERAPGEEKVRCAESQEGCLLKMACGVSAASDLWSLATRHRRGSVLTMTPL